jgi:hypothetical protein
VWKIPGPSLLCISRRLPLAFVNTWNNKTVMRENIKLCDLGRARHKIVYSKDNKHPRIAKKKKDYKYVCLYTYKIISIYICPQKRSKFNNVSRRTHLGYATLGHAYSVEHTHLKREILGRNQSTLRTNGGSI